MIKRGIIWSIVMVFLCSCFIFSTEFARRPDIDSICKYLLSLPGYNKVEIVSNPTGIYEQLSETGVKELRVYKATDDTAKELAVMDFEEEYDNASQAIETLNMRTEELKTEFSDKPEELERIDKARIVLANGFVIYTVYDTEGVAENAVYKYFATR